MIRRLLFVAGIFCVLCAAAPMFWRIFRINAGMLAMLALGLALIFLPIYWGRISSVKPLRNILIFAIIIGVGYSVFVSAFMVKSAFYNEPPQSGEITIIVLGGGIVGDQPSLMLRRRLNVAYRYMRKNPDAVCIVTGGQGPDENYPESVVMKNYLVSVGIPPERVITEDKSKNTYENLKFAATLMAETPAVVVTDSFHQLRANIFARSQGLDAYGLSSSTPWGLLPTYWVRDMLGVGVAWLQTLSGN